MQAGNTLPSGEPREDPALHPPPPPHVQTEAQPPAQDLPSAFQANGTASCLWKRETPWKWPPSSVPPTPSGPGGLSRAIPRGQRTLENVPEARSTGVGSGTNSSEPDAGS